ncbi:hypothetical protein C1645_743190 [Glomus cerebriforme]|uniref:Uncharacterized protein n=1 Tax=Glomus cerebriforme TaxID=658196 RepID=A0A397SEV6_9GLOM|nr:hypothetical protein C1645_743190 [Glomus cerebriforme]
MKNTRVVGSLGMNYLKFPTLSDNPSKLPKLFWRKKLLGTYTLADFDPSNCFLKIKANGAAIIYTLTSGLSQATQALFHDLNTEDSDKSSEERQSERKTKYAGTAKVVGAAMASLPSMLAPSHVKCDYTMSEFALRYEQPSLKLRIEYNSHLFDRYKREKQLKKNGNE